MTNDTERDSFEQFYTRVKYRLRKVLHAGEKRQETTIARSILLVGL